MACHVGAGSIIAAGAVCTEGMEIPPGSLVMGVPGEATTRCHGRRARADRAHGELVSRAAGAPPTRGSVAPPLVVILRLVSSCASRSEARIRFRNDWRGSRNADVFRSKALADERVSPRDPRHTDMLVPAAVATRLRAAKSFCISALPPQAQPFATAPRGYSPPLGSAIHVVINASARPHPRS